MVRIEKINTGRCLRVDVGLDWKFRFNFFRNKLFKVAVPFHSLTRKVCV